MYIGIQVEAPGHKHVSVFVSGLGSKAGRIEPPWPHTRPSHTECKMRLADQRDGSRLGP